MPIMLVPFTSEAVRVTVRGLEQDVILASKVVVAGVSIMCRLSSGLPTGRSHIGAVHFSEIDRATVALSQNVGITIVMEITNANIQTRLRPPK